MKDALLLGKILEKRKREDRFETNLTCFLNSINTHLDVRVVQFQVFEFFPLA